MILLLLALVWAGLGQKAAEKTATALAMPCGLIWFLLTWVSLVACMGKQRKLATVLAGIWMLYTCAGNGIVAGLLAGRLEAPFVQISPLTEQPFDVVVVLGGGAAAGANGRQQGNGSGDRLILAAQLYHRGLTKKLICTGKRIASMNSSGFDPSEQSTDVLVGLGVPESVIEQLGGRTTSEEMNSLGKRFAGSQLRVGLVTSAWHLPRALRLAERNSFQPQPLPSDFMCGPNNPLTFGEWLLSSIPQAEAFAGITRIAKEHLGMLVGR